MNYSPSHQHFADQLRIKIATRAELNVEGCPPDDPGYRARIAAYVAKRLAAGAPVTFAGSPITTADQLGELFD